METAEGAEREVVHHGRLGGSDTPLQVRALSASSAPSAFLNCQYQDHRSISGTTMSNDPITVTTSPMKMPFISLLKMPQAVNEPVRQRTR